ncbi:hypothetical protein HWV01_03595 [Moritella sp. 5]|uniref:hypothetical protein n=1 Tax=Moritella sp. 5 TaxID=2746231 RepID=UPI001BA49E5E|nr:hypothetical protein [Moritella sp. 5]QUM79452.1 hypothetical protein HWV01_03595 [Moritella sp. 5]
MKHLKLIIFLCLLNQGCSFHSNLPMNQPVNLPMNQSMSQIQTLAPATVEDAIEDQPISVDGLGSQQINPSDIVYDDGKKLEEPKKEAEPVQKDANGDIKNMSDTSDFMPKPKSYWM